MGTAEGGGRKLTRRGGPKTMRKNRHPNRAAPLGLWDYVDSLPQALHQRSHSSH
jgi:hypothetical protein